MVRKNPIPKSHSDCEALCVPNPKQRAYGLGYCGLRLVVSKGGTGSWIQRNWIPGGRSVDHTLGSVKEVPLERAREAAREIRVRMRVERAVSRERAILARATAQAQVAEVEPVTFEELAREVVAERKACWRSPKTERAWSRRMEQRAFPILGPMQVQSITRADVLSIFEKRCSCGVGRCDGSSFWTAHTKVARDVLAQVRIVFDKAVARGLREANPCDAALKAGLPRRNAKAKPVHFAAISYSELPAAVRKLEGRDSSGARCLRFLALTVVRESEAAGACWSELDLESATWTVPASRMKEGVEHTVPLSRAALDVLEECRSRSEDTQYIFRGLRNNPIGRRAVWQLWRRAGNSGTVHGLRSTFRDWCRDTGRSREVAEAALAHAFGSSVERAYARSTMLERRRELMAIWAEHLCGSSHEGAER